MFKIFEKLRLTALLAMIVASSSFNLAMAKYDLEPLKNSFAKQATYTSVQVKMKQTKKLPSLKEPIVNTGYLWLYPQKAFRWQMGEPKVQSAVYDGQKVYLLDDKKKTAKVYKSSDRKVKPLLLMLGIGEGASFESLMKTFEVTGVTRKDQQYAVALAPRSGRLKRVIVEMLLQVNLETSYIERIEWTQKDGSVIITEFAKPKLNASLPENIFRVNNEVYKCE